MSNIPEARARLEALRNRAGSVSVRNELTAIIDMLKRQAIKPRRSPIQSVPMTAFIGASIRSIAAAHPNYSNQTIADRFGVNSGRVSEALAGKW